LPWTKKLTSEDLNAIESEGEATFSDDAGISLAELLYTECLNAGLAF
jgi:hypothetical protein